MSWIPIYANNSLSQNTAHDLAVNNLAETEIAALATAQGDLVKAAANAAADFETSLARRPHDQDSGLRTPSETLALKWSDVDWDANKMTVPSPKTEHQNKPYRIVRMFPELRPYLEAAFDAAKEGAVYAVSRYRDDTQNLRTQFMRILRRADVQPWERLFDDLRASRQTELADQFPLHVVTDWIGNSPDIADRHYRKTTEQHFEKAVRGPSADAAHVETMQNPTQ